MVKYQVTITTGSIAGASTFNHIFIKLVGTDGESDRSWLINFKGALAFTPGAVSLKYFESDGNPQLGCLLLVRLPLFPEDSWFPTKVEVKSPEGDTYNFPVYRWITDSALSNFDLSVFLSWDVYKEGIPHCMKADNPLSLPCEVRFSFTKTSEFLFTAASGSALLFPDYVQEHWKEDAFFGYQFLNGINPMLIRRCSVLPENFPVTDGMVRLPDQCSLEDEMKKGNIYLCDYKRLDGVEANIINGKKQYLMAPLVLLHKTPEDKMMPIAIQLKQTPGEDNPIFFPTDSEYDWLMAKIFVRSADFSEHQLNVHLLRTHLLAEVFAVSLLRNVPMVHPLYKLLIPHTRYTLQINFLARLALISDTGVFTQFSASGGEAMLPILKRSLSSVTYSSLCIPDDIAERGLEAVPNYYYRDDGLKLWEIIHRFVQGILSYYYKRDAEVQQDSELQKWISDIYEHGFLSQPCPGIPKSLTTVVELIKFVTMVIFTGSGQHSAVNTGQYDYGGWMPNTPISLEATMLQTFPDVNVTVQGMSTVWLLSKQSSDFVSIDDFM
uniref:Uncharacterized protein n=1 Tax=Labrus bergylta TaxID=56723 RepID=A0A3Q3E1U4_9LABR